MLQVTPSSSQILIIAATLSINTILLRMPKITNSFLCKIFRNWSEELLEQHEMKQSRNQIGGEVD